MNQDEQHLRLLVIFHYVLAGMVALVSLFPSIHLAWGISMLANPRHNQFPGPDESFMGVFMIVFAVVFILGGLTLAALIFVTGRFLNQRKHLLFCLVMAGIECIFSPFGTVLGIFTIIVLMQDTVKTMFKAQATPLSS